MTYSDGPFGTDQALSFDGTSCASFATGSVIPGDFSATLIFSNDELSAISGTETLDGGCLFCIGSSDSDQDVKFSFPSVAFYDDTPPDTYILQMNMQIGLLISSFSFTMTPGVSAGGFGTIATDFHVLTVAKEGDDWRIFLDGIESDEGLTPATALTLFGDRGLFFGGNGDGDYIQSKWAAMFVHGKALTLADHASFIADLRDNDGANVLPPQ